MDTQTTGEFAGEEVKSSYEYPLSYELKGIDEQVERLQELFPGIGGADESVARQPLPDGAEGYFVIPRWRKIADRYEKAVEKVLNLIKWTREGKLIRYFYDERGDPQYFRQRERTAAMLEHIGNQQSGYDILVVPAQFGKLHGGLSVDQAQKVFGASEFGLGTCEAGIMLLMNPERLQNDDDFSFDCAGDGFFLDDDHSFSGAPYFFFDDDWIIFEARCPAGPDVVFASVTGFVPQS